METMQNVVAQEWIEERFNRKHIDRKIRNEIEANQDMVTKITEGVELVKSFLAGTYYDSKNKRLAQISTMDIQAMVFDLFVGVCYSQVPELLTSVTAKMSARLGFSDRTEAIITVAELLAVLCETDAFDIFKETPQSSLMLVSRIPLSDELMRFIEHSEYLPPMVCTPLKLTHNFSSGYLTHNDSLILGKGNHHDGDICLDVLNTMNKVAYQLDLEFLLAFEELPTFELDDQDKTDNWKRFKAQSSYFYKMLWKQGNQFYFNHKVDKRGRIYTQGYHLNPQGAPFKKAMLELAHEEPITGVPA